MTLVSIKKILPEKVNALKLGGALKLQGLGKDWDKILNNALGRDWQKKSKPVKLKNKALIVVCQSSVWANELQLKERILLKEFGHKAKELEIEKIKFIS